MKITLDIPDKLAQSDGFTQTDWLREIAIALFQQELIILGTASKIAGMHQIEFQALLSDRGLCVHYDLADYQADITSLRENHWR
ncbi:MAG: UPF0175 family protein [Leptolyngbya sp. RL_3_1]|nr:UPF0175 family protein [Leptolyngbya sp. RL_3_1]